MVALTARMHFGAAWRNAPASPVERPGSSEMHIASLLQGGLMPFPTQRQRAKTLPRYVRSCKGNVVQNRRPLRVESLSAASDGQFYNSRNPYERAPAENVRVLRYPDGHTRVIRYPAEHTDPQTLSPSAGNESLGSMGFQASSGLSMDRNTVFGDTMSATTEGSALTEESKVIVIRRIYISRQSQRGKVALL